MIELDPKFIIKESHINDKGIRVITNAELVEVSICQENYYIDDLCKTNKGGKIK